MLATIRTHIADYVPADNPDIPASWDVVDGQIRGMVAPCATMVFLGGDAGDATLAIDTSASAAGWGGEWLSTAHICLTRRIGQMPEMSTCSADAAHRLFMTGSDAVWDCEE